MLLVGLLVHSRLSVAIFLGGVKVICRSVASCGVSLTDPPQCSKVSCISELGVGNNFKGSWAFKDLSSKLRLAGLLGSAVGWGWGEAFLRSSSLRAADVPVGRYLTACGNPLGRSTSGRTGRCPAFSSSSTDHSMWPGWPCPLWVP